MNFEVTPEILLRQVGKAHANKINQMLEEVGLHKGQPMMLLLLSRKDGIPQSALVKKMVVTPATVSMMVKRLEKAGFVIRKRDAEDERVTNVYLTDAGRDIGMQLNKLQKELENIVFDGFSAEEKETLNTYLSRVLENLYK